MPAANTAVYVRDLQDQAKALQTRVIHTHTRTHPLSIVSLLVSVYRATCLHVHVHQRQLLSHSILSLSHILAQARRVRNACVSVFFVHVPLAQCVRV